MVHTFHLLLDRQPLEMNTGWFQESLPIPSRVHDFTVHFSARDCRDVEDTLPKILTFDGFWRVE